MCIDRIALFRGWSIAYGAHITVGLLNGSSVSFLQVESLVPLSQIAL